MIKAEGPKESKAQKQARLAEEQTVENERLRAERARLEETQGILGESTMRLRRRFGAMPGGASSMFTGSGSTTGDLNIAQVIANSILSGSGLAPVRNRGKSGSNGATNAGLGGTTAGRTNSLVALV